MSFERALLHIFKVEGGYVDRPEDKGGPTNFGITQKTLAAFRKNTVGPDDVRNLTATEAGRIYRQEYWDANALFLIDNPRVQYLLFDQIVSRGGRSAILIMQRVLNSYPFNAGLKYDGILGTATAQTVNCVDDELELSIRFIRECQRAYLKQAHLPGQAVFLEGWLNRTFLLFDFLFDGVR